MNEKIDKETLQNLINKADECYQSNDFTNAINYYITVINQLADDDKKYFYYVFGNLGSSYLEQAFILINTDKEKSSKNALYADKAFEIAAHYHPQNPDYLYYIAIAKNMAVSGGLNHPDDIKLINAAIYYYKKAKNQGCKMDDLDQRLEFAQGQSALILADINSKYQNEIVTGDQTRKSKNRVTFSSDTLFNDNKNSAKNLKSKSENNEPESNQKLI